MYRFPENLYCDVRIEEVFETKILYAKGELEESKVRTYKGAFIRIFDGKRWYYSSTSRVQEIQSEIEQLAKFATPNERILQHPTVKKFQVNTDRNFQYTKNSVADVPMAQKHELLKGYFPMVADHPYVTFYQGAYVDRRVIRQFYSSKGADLAFDTQTAGFALFVEMLDGEKRFSEGFQKAGDEFKKLLGFEEDFKQAVKEIERTLHEAEPVVPGKYTVVLSPLAAGIFAHESFGHKSEADFMIGDEAMKAEWAIGKTVGTDILSIVDTGEFAGSGYVPFDDEGTRTEKTYLVKDGVLTGRLHSALTADSLTEEVTGNARAKDFEYEPIVRMTTTYIEAGTQTKEELISGIEDGILVETIKHGSGMSTFTIAPSRAYLIKNGQVGKPVSISVITGNVMETLHEIDGVSDQLEILSFVTGGCGKMEQYPLPVGFGGPYVRIRNLNVM